MQQPVGHRFHRRGREYVGVALGGGEPALVRVSADAFARALAANPEATFAEWWRDGWLLWWERSASYWFPADGQTSHIYVARLGSAAAGKANSVYGTPPIPRRTPPVVPALVASPGAAPVAEPLAEAAPVPVLVGVA